MMSDFRGGGGSKMTPKNRTLEGKKRTLGGGGGQKSSKIGGHHLCTFPKGTCTRLPDSNLSLIVLYKTFVIED